MSEQTSPATALLAAIRDASKSAKLIGLSDLAALRRGLTDGLAGKPGNVPEADPAGSEEPQTAGTVEIESLLAAQADDDIKLMRGTRDVYYFSDTRMTAAYALHLFRVAEKDPARMVADTVRDESRIYPRPTPASTFLDVPFRMSEAELDGILWQISQRNDMTDIKRTTASDGSLYLYSSDYLEDAHADSLAEWDAVGQAENP
jgi:hypothetical protein